MLNVYPTMGSLLFRFSGSPYGYKNDYITFYEGVNFSGEEYYTNQNDPDLESENVARLVTK